MFSSHPITGKTTLTESLKGAMGAALLRSPPQCLSPFRARFDQEPPLIRRAFYALGNYITADQITREAANAPVIVDRWSGHRCRVRIPSPCEDGHCFCLPPGSGTARQRTPLPQQSAAQSATSLERVPRCTAGPVTCFSPPWWSCSPWTLRRGGGG